jgi:hypothetical protein
VIGLLGSIGVLELLYNIAESVIVSCATHYSFVIVHVSY